MQNKNPKCYLPHEYINRSNENISSFYKNMFIEDINNRIIPLSLRRNEGDCKAIIDCKKEDLDLVRMILNCFSTYREKYDIGKLIKNAIQGICRNITWYGESIYEIYKESDNNIKFIGLIPTNFIDLKFLHIQTAPKSSEKVLYPRVIPNKLLWKIGLPQKLEKNYTLKTILLSIDQFHSHMPKSMQDDLYERNSLSSYDTKKYEEKCFLFVNDLTSDWGWDQRKWTSNNTSTEFYNTYKQIKFKYSLAIFREHIVLELNNLFSRLEIDVSIRLEGLMSSSEYADNLEKYLNNQIAYKDAFDLLH